MVNYDYFKQIKTNGNLPVAIIDFLSNIDATYFRFKNGEGTEYLLSKVNFPAKSAI